MNNKRGSITSIFIFFIFLGVAVWYFGVLAKTDWNYKRLSRLDGVISVEKIDMEKRFNSCIESKYLVTFEQPLDWENPDVGTFPQRVEIGFADKASVNFLETDGYSLNADRLKTDHVYELVDMYSGNYVHIEHRFFGASCPDDLSYDEVKYWEYLTCENSANDYHNIYNKLKPLLGDKWVGYGFSNGGLMTDAYASFFPNDMNLYVSYSAPCADGIADKRFYDFIYNRIGDDSFGSQEGQRLRSLVTQFQVELIKNKDELMSFYIDAIDKTGMRFRQDAQPEVLYDLNVLESAVMIWQYGQPFDELQKVVEMADGTDEEHEEKIHAEFDMMISLQSPGDWSPDFFGWPYYVTGATEIGQYYYDFSYLRDAIKDPEVLEQLTVTPDMELNLLWDTVFTREQRDAFRFKKGFRDELISSLKETDARMIMLSGATDPWFSVRVPETGNENIKEFVHPTSPHIPSIRNYSEEVQKEIQEIIDSSISKR